MNDIMNTSLTVTSLEIAALVESQHSNVKISIERLAKRGVIRLPALQVSDEINNLGFTVKRECYLFAGEQGKRDSIIVVAQLSPEFTARLVDRWQELEARAAQHKITDPVLAALVHSLTEIDNLKQQQLSQNAKLDKIEDRVEQVEIQHRNGVPHGHMSKKQAHTLYGRGLSEAVFHEIMAKAGVNVERYIHLCDDGHEVPTYAYVETEIEPAVSRALSEAVQVTSYFCETPLLNGRRFCYRINK